MVQILRQIEQRSGPGALDRAEREERLGEALHPWEEESLGEAPDPKRTDDGTTWSHAGRAGPTGLGSRRRRRRAA
jgi:hypothetical protein